VSVNSMDEKRSVEETDRPRTVKSIKMDLLDGGIDRESDLLVHSSLSSIGWVCGGPVAVIKALLQTLSSGTLVMPTFTGGHSDPSSWENPPVPESWWDTIREEMPAFDPEITPVGRVGKIPEVFRKWPGVKRSYHPVVSFAAKGPNADLIVEDHPLDLPFGKDSPLQRLYDLDAYVLLIGVGHDRNTCFHLGENLAPGAEKRTEGSSVKDKGRKVWKEFKDIKYRDDQFEKVGKEFEKECTVEEFKVGSADCKYFSIKDAVDLSERWFTEFRGSG